VSISLPPCERWSATKLSDRTLATPEKRFLIRSHLIKKDFLFFIVITIAALAIGLSINFFRGKSLPLAYVSKEVRLEQAVKKLSQPSNPSQAPGTTLPVVLTLAEFSDFVENRRGIVLDARYRIDHQLAHVPGALSLPRDEFSDGYASLKSKLQANRSQPIAIYCDGKDCVDSKLVQKALWDLGYKQVAVFKGGWSEWTAAGKRKEANR